jgi:HK97 family phage major capsid protein
LEGVLRSLDESARKLTSQRSPSRFAGPGASEEHVRSLANQGEDYEWVRKGYRLEHPSGDESPSRRQFLLDVRSARFGDGRAAARLHKAWVGGTPSAGGFLVSPEVLPGYVQAMRAAAPLRSRCAEFAVSSNEVWVVVEGDSIEVVHTGEGVTKFDSTGTVAQRIATTHKLAGTSTVSDELLVDSHGNAEALVSSQFGKAIGIGVDAAIIGGSGIGQPTGILSTVGIASQAVDGQTGAGGSGSTP